MDYPYASLGPTLQVVVLVFLLVFAVALLGLLIFMAALPGRLAAKRNHPQAASVNLLGWLGLPTGVLWVVAMAWAVWNRSNSSNTNGTLHLEAQLSRLERAVGELEAKLGERA